MSVERLKVCISLLLKEGMGGRKVVDVHMSMYIGIF